MSISPSLLRANARIQEGSKFVNVGFAAIQAVLLFGKKSTTVFNAALAFEGTVNEAPLAGSGITVDATLRLAHGRTSEVTDHAVEDGSVITDNVVNRPIRLHVEAMVTDAPFEFLSGVRRSIANASSAIDQLSGGTPINQLRSNPSRSQSAFDALNDLWTKRLPFTMVTRRRIYQTMVFTNLEFSDSEDTVESLRFSADMKQIVIATQAFDELAVKPAMKDRAKRKKTKGAQPTKTAPPATEKATFTQMNPPDGYAWPVNETTSTPTEFVP